MSTFAKLPLFSKVIHVLAVGYMAYMAVYTWNVLTDPAVQEFTINIVNVINK